MMNGGYLSKEQILAADDLQYRDVHVPEWGGIVRLREMTGAEREDFENAVVAAQKADGRVENLRATMLSMCIVDAAGNRLFTADDVAALGRKSGVALIRVFTEAQKLSALTAEEAGALEKNSGPGPSADSSSA